MQERYRIYQRGGKNFYAKDTKTGRAFSLSTSDEREAMRLVTAKNQSTEQPCLNVAMARVYLSAQSPEFTKRTWGQLIDLVASGYEGATAVRWRKFAKSAPLKVLASLPIYQTEAAHILAVLDHKKAGVSTNVWLRILHNRALDLGWLLAPALHKKLWPKVKYKVRRGITADEHAKIIASEQMEDYARFFRMLWETGGSQTDIANLNAEDVDWTTSRLYYSRQKLKNRGGGRAALTIGAGLRTLLHELPSSGPLFPRLRLLTEDERASHFRKVCLRVEVAGVTLHSYRYSWAERACSAGMPEREAQAHLGHGSIRCALAKSEAGEVLRASDCVMETELQFGQRSQRKRAWFKRAVQLRSFMTDPFHLVMVPAGV
jgi:integrase